MELRVLNSPAAVAQVAAKRLVELRPKSVALSGGSTPRALYELLAEPAEPFREQIAWGDIDFFFSDERHVPPDHPDSNYRMANETLFTRVPAPPHRVHRIPAENPIAVRAAEEYEAGLRNFFGAARPAFDLLLLGLGEDGHTASLFPGSPALRETERLVAAPWVEKFSAYRITLTLPVLNNAGSVIFLVTGASKANILEKVLEGGPNSEGFPAHAVQPASGNLLWLVDEAAAALIK